MLRLKVVGIREPTHEITQLITYANKEGTAVQSHQCLHCSEDLRKIRHPIATVSLRMCLCRIDL